MYRLNTASVCDDKSQVTAPIEQNVVRGETSSRNSAVMAGLPVLILSVMLMLSSSLTQWGVILKHKNITLPQWAASELWEQIFTLGKT